DPMIMRTARESSMTSARMFVSRVSTEYAVHRTEYALSSGTSGSQTPVWEQVSAKLCFALPRGATETEFRRQRVPKREFGNQGTTRDRAHLTARSVLGTEYCVLATAYSVLNA